MSLRDGETALKVHRLVPEPLPMRWRIRKGFEGDVDGEPFRLTGTSALRRSHRSVTYEGPTSNPTRCRIYRDMAPTVITATCGRPIRLPG